MKGNFGHLLFDISLKWIDQKHLLDYEEFSM